VQGQHLVNHCLSENTRPSDPGLLLLEGDGAIRTGCYRRGEVPGW